MNYSNVSLLSLTEVAAAAAAAAAKSFQSCPTLCDPIDGSPPGSSIHGIFQARVLEWGAIAFSETLFSILYLFSETSSPALHDLLGIASLNTQNTKRFKITMIEILLKKKI